ncbi:hypothetical protein [Streptomyces humi]|uniref:hypothetical protein n=1 Tax=Streptomyces humi TaxID=1428620 RepID=UPI00142E3ED2|nr:hypothetical protein [Streptomyces humi]
MTRPTAQKPALRVARTGWAKKRHLPRRGVRTCVAAVADESASPAARSGAEWNIVRGDD